MLIKRTKPRPMVQGKLAPIAASPMPPVRVARTATPLLRAKLPDNQMKGKVVVSPTEAKQVIYECLQLIADAEDAIDRATEQIATSHARIEAVMLQQKWNTVDDGTYQAKYREQYSRQETYVDPKKMRGAVGNDDFWRAIEVRIGVLRTILTEREILAMADVKPAKSLGFKLEVKKIGRKK